MNTAAHADPNQRFAIPDALTIEPGAGGLPRITVSNRHARAQVYLHGAHVSHFQPHGGEAVLWLSAQSWFERDRPIRGGVPICWPWFGPHASRSDLPAHGFARLRPWSLIETAQTADGRTRIELALESDQQSMEQWPHAFQLRYTVTVGNTLELDLRVDNPGDQSFTCDEALHTYLAVGDVRRVAIDGLAGCDYLDKLRGLQRFVQDRDPLTLAAETDRVYLGTRTTCVVRDPVLNRQLTVAKRGSLATVVWNPWIAKAKAMKDFGDEEWPGMLCVETVNAADHALTIPPGGSHHLHASIGMDRLPA